MFLLLTASLGLFPSPALAPDRLLSQIAELVLRTRLRECGSCEVAVRAEPSSVLSGAVDRVKVRGRRWCTPMRLSCATLDVEVGRTAVDFGALATKRRILLRAPATGSAQIRFTARDWDGFLLHPLMREAVAARQALEPHAPALTFSGGGGTRLLPGTPGSDGAVLFPVRAAKTELSAELRQDASGRVVCSCSAGGADEAASSAAASAGPWLARLFETLVLDLDGCELSFRSLRVEPDATLALDLRARVRAFPSLDINF